MSPLMKLSPLLIAISCALPALAQSDETAKRFHVLPHLADGGGWRSSLLVTNVSEAASPCTLQLYGLGVDRFDDYSADGAPRHRADRSCPRGLTRVRMGRPAPCRLISLVKRPKDCYLSSNIPPENGPDAFAVRACQRLRRPPLRYGPAGDTPGPLRPEGS